MALKFRRGTTAQKSGSLAFGEPYVNTTLGTLQIGGQNGDISLLINSSSTGISGSSLDITGNAKIDGDLTLGGKITIGDASSDTVNVIASLSSSLIPSETNAFDLGSSEKIWRDLYISTGSIKFVNSTGSVVSSLSATTVNSLLQSTGSIEERLTQIGVVSGSLISSASAASISITNINSTTASLNTSVSNINTFSGSQLTQNTNLATITGSLIASASSFETRNASLATITGSLISTASVNTQRLTAIENVSGSWVTEAETASFARTNTTNVFTTNQIISGGLDVTGTITANEFHTTFVTSSVMYNSGSNRFGDSADDLQQLIGIVEITGSIKGTQFNDLATVTGSLIVSASSFESRNASLATITGSLISSASSFESRNASLATISGSLISTASNHEQRIAANESISSSYARTNLSNTFNNDQTFSGSIYLTGRVRAQLAVSASSVNINTADGNSQLELVNSTTGRGFHLISYDGDSFSVHAPTTGQSAFRIDSGSQYHSHFFGDVYVTSGSLLVNAVSASAGFSGSVNGIGNVTAFSSSLNTSITNLNTFSSSQLTKDSTLATYTGSVETRLTEIGVVSGSLISSASTAKTTNDSQDVSITNLNTFSGSQLTQNTNLATITGSLILTASNLTQRVEAVESVSGTFARTNSTNTFNGTQTISGSLYVTQDLIVQGSSSIQNISSSNLTIGTAYVTLNTNTPTSRYAGLIIIDSGSVGSSGSIVYDAVDDEVLFIHKGNGTNVTSSHFILGPETYDNLGNETYLTNNKLTKGTGKEHLADSQITDDGTTVSIAGNLDLTGSIKAPQLNTLATYTGSVESRFATLASYTGSNDTTNTTQNSRLDQLSTASGSAISRLNTLEVETANLETFSSSALTRLSNLEGTDISITLTGDVTGTGTITNLGNVSFATTIAANSVALGTDTTGDYVASLVAGTNITLTNNSGEGATPTIGLTNNAITIAGASTSLGGTISAATIGNAIGAFSGSSQVSLGSASGNIALSTQTTGDYVASLVAGTNITLTNNSGEGATPTIALTNNTISGISLGSNLATLTIGSGLSGTSYNGSTGVTITNAGVLSNVAGTGISVSAGTGNVTITNTGVTSLTAGTGVGVSAGTGAVTVSIGQAVATTSSPTFAGLTINGAITATGDITAYYTSDKRHKNNIQIIPNALSKVRALNGVTWEWNDDVNEVTKSTPKTGLIAQEVQSVLPEVVIEKVDGFLGLDYSKMMGLMVEAIKEQQLQIDNLTLKIAELEKQKGL